jgi:hypothetical protein
MHSTPPDQLQNEEALVVSPWVIPFASERADNFPRQRVDKLGQWPHDRGDFLIAAYNMILLTSWGEEMFQRLVKIKSERKRLVESIVWKPGQIRLSGIFKQLLGKNSLVNSDYDSVIEDIQFMFRPETIKPEREFHFAAPEEELVEIEEFQEGVREEVATVVSQPIHKRGRVLAPLPGRTKIRNNSVVNPVALVLPTVQDEVNEFLRERTDPPARQEYRWPVRPPRFLDRRPGNLKAEVWPAIPSPAPEKVTPEPVFPRDLGYEWLLEWLRSEASVQAGLAATQLIPDFKRDDLSLRTLFRQDYPLLFDVFFHLSKTSGSSWKTILHDIHFPDPLSIARKEPWVVQQLSACFELHQQGEHEAFTNTLRGILNNESFYEKITAICEKYWISNPIEAAARIIDFPWTPDDARMYQTITLRETLDHTDGFKVLQAQIDSLPADVSLRELRSKLSWISIYIPLWTTTWFWYKAKRAVASTLFEVLEALVKADTSYEKGDEKSTKKLRRKLAQVSGE